ncbi:MAG: lipase family alpha/beta hydrolase [Sphingomonadaceae bacterium]
MTTAANTETIQPPSPLLALTELPRAIFEFGTLPFAALLTQSAPRGDGHPVMVLPGFVTTDISTGPLRRYLASMGYDVHAWELGRNLGPKAIGREGEKLIARLESIYEKTGRKVSLVGWSLGGILARQLSRRRPEMVRQVISLGSPFVGDPRASNVWQAYEFLTGQRLKDPDTRAQLRESEEVPPVPATAIYTKGDGIVAWQNCREPVSAHTDNVEVSGSHCGLGVNGLVYYAVADRLAQPEGSWKPFAPKGMSRLLYPSQQVH